MAFFFPVRELKTLVLMYNTALYSPVARPLHFAEFYEKFNTLNVKAGRAHDTKAASFVNNDHAFNHLFQREGKKYSRSFLKRWQFRSGTNITLYYIFQKGQLCAGYFYFLFTLNSDRKPFSWWHEFCERVRFTDDHTQDSTDEYEWENNVRFLEWYSPTRTTYQAVALSPKQQLSSKREHRATSIIFCLDSQIRIFGHLAHPLIDFYYEATRCPNSVCISINYEHSNQIVRVHIAKNSFYLSWDLRRIWIHLFPPNAWARRINITKTIVCHVECRPKWQ